MSADYIGKEVSFTALGKEWKTSRWDGNVWEKIQGWAKEVLPDPLLEIYKSIDVVTLKDAEIVRKLILADRAEEKLAKDEGREPVLMMPLYQNRSDLVVKEAIALKTSLIALNSPQMASLLVSPHGILQVLLFLLEKYHKADVNREVVSDIYAEVGMPKCLEITMQAQGKNA